jgi:hypothetical protein
VTTTKLTIFRLAQKLFVDINNVANLVSEKNGNTLEAIADELIDTTVAHTQAINSALDDAIALVKSDPDGAVEAIERARKSALPQGHPDENLDHIPNVGESDLRELDVETENSLGWDLSDTEPSDN